MTPWMLSVSLPLTGQTQMVSPSATTNHQAGPGRLASLCPTVFCIWGKDERDEAERLADLIAFLKEKQVIADYSQVALLLHSVRLDHGRYLAALENRGIPAFCPRVRAFSTNRCIEGRPIARPASRRLLLPPARL